MGLNPHWERISFSEYLDENSGFARGVPGARKNPASFFPLLLFSKNSFLYFTPYRPIRQRYPRFFSRSRPASFREK